MCDFNEIVHACVLVAGCSCKLHLDKKANSQNNSR
jgi:hypothetical protein